MNINFNTASHDDDDADSKDGDTALSDCSSKFAWLLCKSLRIEYESSPTHSRYNLLLIIVALLKEL